MNYFLSHRIYLINDFIWQFLLFFFKCYSPQYQADFIVSDSLDQFVTASGSNADVSGAALKFDRALKPGMTKSDFLVLLILFLNLLTFTCLLLKNQTVFLQMNRSLQLNVSKEYC